MSTFGRVEARSDQGRVRSRNEDAVVVRDGLVAVADGMGGHRDGQRASRIAVELVDECASILLESASDPERAMDTLEALFQEASERVSKELGGQGGTTLVCAIAKPDGSGAYVAHAGDSRAYELAEDDELRRLTQDHNVYATLIERGLSHEEASRHPAAAKLTMALGFGFVQPDVAEVALGPDGRLLICTDGLHGVVDELGIARRLALPDPVEAADALLTAALDAGAPDNVTLAVLEAPADSRAAAGIDVLRGLHLFSTLDEAQLRNVAPFLKRRTWRDGEVIAREGDPSDSCIALVRGNARVERGSMLLATIGRGEVVGELALAGALRRSATLRAEGPVEALVLTRDGYDTLCRVRPIIGVKLTQALAQALARRLVDVNERMERVRSALDPS